MQVTVRNTGERRSREVVQLYASRPSSAVPRPARWLVGYATVEAGAGEQAAVAIDVPFRALRHWDVTAHRWALERGRFELRVGRSSRDLRLKAELEPDWAGAYDGELGD